MTTESEDQLEGATMLLLRAIGEDWDRGGLVDTPSRVAKMWVEITEGLQYDDDGLSELVNGAVFEEGTYGMVIVKDIPFYSICEHHLIPFHGTAAVGYIDQGKVVGLSKIARLVDLVARRPQVQERITQVVAKTLMDSNLDPEGVGVIIEAEHLCMSMRGIKKPGSKTVTSAMLGTFRDDPAVRTEFMTLLKSRS